MITTLKAPYTQWGHTMPSFFTTPSDYSQNPNKLYPVILFFHGKGEAGTDINRVLSNYLPKRAAAGDIVGTSPQGVQEKFIVIGGQDGYWSPYPPTFKIVYDYIVNTYKLRVDPNRIYVTGLSAGGQTSLMYACYDGSFIGKVAACAPLSPSPIEEKIKPNLTLMGKARTHTFFWSGNTDTSFTNAALEYTKILNTAAGDNIASTTVFNGGHCCWDSVYSGSVKIKSLDGKKDLNIYDWFLQFSLDNTTSTTTSTTTTTTTKKPMYKISITLDSIPTSVPVAIKLADGTEIPITVEKV